jgi:hypothetical protein
VSDRDVIMLSTFGLGAVCYVLGFLHGAPDTASKLVELLFGVDGMFGATIRQTICTVRGHKPRSWTRMRDPYGITVETILGPCSRCGCALDEKMGQHRS